MSQFHLGLGHETSPWELHPIWEAKKLLGGSLMEVEELIGVVDLVLRCGASASIPSVAVRPRSPV